MKVKGIDLNRVKTFTTTYRPTDEEKELLAAGGFELIKSDGKYETWSKEDNMSVALIISDGNGETYQAKLTLYPSPDMIFTLEMFDEN